MYVCYECGLKFETPKMAIEAHGFDSPPYERYLVCPNCNCNKFAFTKRCIECNHYIDDNYADTPFGWICEECYTIKNVFEDENDIT